MRKKKMLFIYNPCAGKGAMKSKLSDVMETFMRADYEVTVYATQREREATELVMELGEKYDRIVCSGGDGTLHEVTQGLMICRLRAVRCVVIFQPELSMILPGD